MAGKRYLLAPGPTPVPPEVLAAGAEPVLHHRGPDFRAVMLRCLERLGPASRQNIGDRSSTDVLRHDEGIAALLADIEHAGNVRVLVQAGHRLGFAAEAVEAVRLDRAPIHDADHHVAVELTITVTEPGVQGDRVSGARKPATLETGLVVQVPLFIEAGEKIKVDTRTGEYLARA